jgi:hypothetical protein
MLNCLKASVLFNLLGLIQAFGQCPVTDFSVSSTGCQNETLALNNLSVGAINYEWDFCSGDLALTPVATPIFNNIYLQRSRSFRVVKFNLEWIGFAIDQVNDKLLRFDFGNNLANTPQMTNLNNPGNALQNAFDFQIYFENSNWHVFIANTGGNNLIRLDFGGDLKSIPTTNVLGSYGLLNTPNGIFAVSENGLLTLFISNGATPEIVRLAFGNSVNNTPATNVISVTGASGLRGISLI